jgi:transposase
VATDIIGASGRAMLEALVGGTHDPEVLAALAKGRLRSKLPAVRAALAGRFRTDHHGLLVAQLLAHVDDLDEAVALLSARIQQLIAPYAEQVALLDTIPGVDRRAAEVIVAEIGPDMGQFPTAAHLASWAGVCPGNNESAGKHRSGRTRKGPRVAGRLPERGRQGSQPDQGHLPERPVPPPAGSPRPGQGHHGRRPFGPGERRPRPGPGRGLPGAGRRLLLPAAPLRSNAISGSWSASLSGWATR